MKRAEPSYHLRQDEAWISFAARQAFRERDRVFESVLDLSGFDPALHADARAAAVERGIRFASLAAGDSPEHRRRVHALSTALSADVPSVEEIRPATYVEWLAGWLEAPHARPDLLVIAFDGGAPVALSYVSVGPDGTGFNHMTGVLPAYRGQRLGLVVKVEALRLAQVCAVTEVRTNNHFGNRAMLAINARLGYRRLVGPRVRPRLRASSLTPCRRKLWSLRDAEAGRPGPAFP